ASLISVQTAPLEGIRARLLSNESLVSYFVSGETLYGFVISSGTTVRGKRLNAAGLNEDVLRFRDVVQNKQAAADAGQALYNRLIRPLESGIQDGPLTISPHLVLHYVPFSALYDGRRYLLDIHSPRMTPSASTLVYLPNGESGKQ